MNGNTLASKEYLEADGVSPPFCWQGGLGGKHDIVVSAMRASGERQATELTNFMRSLKALMHYGAICKYALKTKK